MESTSSSSSDVPVKVVKPKVEPRKTEPVRETCKKPAPPPAQSKIYKREDSEDSSSGSSETEPPVIKSLTTVKDGIVNTKKVKLVQEQEQLKNSAVMNKDEIVVTTKGDRMVFIDSDYTVKSNDTFLVINANKSIKIKLFQISSGKTDVHLSKRVVIKAVKPLLQHTIECSKHNDFDMDPEKRSVILVGRDACQLQTAGKSWIIVSNQHKM